MRKNYNDLMLLIYAVEFEDKKGVFLDKNVGLIVSLLLLSNDTNVLADIYARIHVNQQVRFSQKLYFNK